MLLGGTEVERRQAGKVRRIMRGAERIEVSENCNQALGSRNANRNGWSGNSRNAYSRNGCPVRSRNAIRIASRNGTAPTERSLSTGR
ncbi:MAG: hypothetical protein ACREFT_09870 [Acetobacteraceae bacterium]